MRLRHFAIVGGGASGLLAAVQLLARPSVEKVDLFEPRPEVGAGIAYGTEHPGHLLNVPARAMSAFPDDCDHFVNWLATQPKWAPEGGWTPRSFVPRRLYRDYLRSLIAPGLDGSDTRLRIHHERVIDLHETGDGVAVETLDGMRREADAVVLATGNEAPSGQQPPWMLDYWSSPSGFDIPADAPVAIFGTGLSMVDSVISLLDSGHTAPITAISRRGLLPQRHDPSFLPQELGADEVPFGAEVSMICHWLRNRVAVQQADRGADWRMVIDSLRPHTQKLWQSLSPAQKERFLRHARPWWDVHRHRMAPQIHDRIEAAQAKGQLRVRAGRITAVTETGGMAAVRMRPRGCAEDTAVDARYVIDCRGHGADAHATGNPLLRTLFDRGTLRPDAMRLGIDVTAACAAIARHGEVSRCIFAIGPATIGTFWEIVAIPDIRVQAQALAERLAEPAGT